MTGDNLSPTNSSAVFQDGTMLPLFVNESGQLVVQRGSVWLDHTKIPGFVRTHIQKPQASAKLATTQPKAETIKHPVDDSATIADLLNNPNYILDRALQYRVGIKIRKMKEAALA